MTWRGSSKQPTASKQWSWAPSPCLLDLVLGAALKNPPIMIMMINYDYQYWCSLKLMINCDAITEFFDVWWCDITQPQPITALNLCKEWTHQWLHQQPLADGQTCDFEIKGAAGCSFPHFRTVEMFASLNEGSSFFNAACSLVSLRDKLEMFTSAHL